MALTTEVMRIGLHQDLRGIRQDFRLATPRSTDACVADPEPGGDLRQSGVLAQVHQRHHRPLGRTELAAPVALTSDNQHGNPLHERMRQVKCGRWMTNEALRER